MPFLAPCVYSIAIFPHSFLSFSAVYSFSWHKKHQHSTNTDPAENALSDCLSLSHFLSPLFLSLAISLFSSQLHPKPGDLI